MMVLLCLGVYESRWDGPNLREGAGGFSLEQISHLVRPLAGASIPNDLAVMAITVPIYASPPSHPN